MDVAIIIAVISLLGNIVLGAFQFIKDKRKADTDSMAQLITKALEMNKQELEVVRIISDELRKQLEAEIKAKNALELKVDEQEARLLEQQKTIDKQQRTIDQLSFEKEDLKLRLERCELQLQNREKL